MLSRWNASSFNGVLSTRHISLLAIIAFPSATFLCQETGTVPRLWRCQPGSLIKDCLVSASISRQINRFGCIKKHGRLGMRDALPRYEAFVMARVQTASGPSDWRPQFAGKRAGAFLEIEALMPSEITAISPLVDQLMRLIEGSHCVCGEEASVELALTEALNNAVVHGNRMDRQKSVQILCRCELGNGISIVVKDHGQGFDPAAVADPTLAENMGADHGRGVWIMKTVMDEVSFECGGAEVRMRKAPRRQPGTKCGAAGKRTDLPNARD